MSKASEVFAAVAAREADEQRLGATSMSMPRYQCHKQVWALHIKEIYFDSDLRGPSEETDGTAIIVPDKQGYGPFRVSAAYVSKHQPKAGGYFVVYDDGYQSWSPAEAFEDGYAPVSLGDVPPYLRPQTPSA